MDAPRFDALARAVANRRTVVAGLAAFLAARGAAPEDVQGRRRRECGAKRPCAAGFNCRDRRCTCDSGVTCGGACCAAGQQCLDGQCGSRPTPPCLGFGAICKGAGVPCCDGLTCASGQGGQRDIRCFVPAGGACEDTAECVYGASCVEGACVATPEPGPAPTCDIVAGPDSLANGRALKAAIENAPAGATILVGGGAYEFRSNTSIPILSVSRDLALAACGTGTPNIAVVEGTAAFRGTTIRLFMVSGDATLSVAGVAFSWHWTSNGDATAFGVIDSARVILEASTVQGFNRGISASSASRIEFRGGVRIISSRAFGIDMFDGNAGPNPPDRSRIGCSGNGNEVSGSGGANNCNWYSSGSTGICPTGCGCVCKAGQCSSQTCSA